MYVLATCTASVLRGTTTDVYGDVHDNGAVHASGIPAAITQSAATAYDPATEAPRIVRIVAGVLPSDTDVTDGDQLRDDTHGITYSIQSVTQNRTQGRTPDMELVLRQVN